ncbi:MAG TPA: tetratricopeptide repeat protein [Sedimentisphaerales bacterium]|nr:tetratricopeptide repeat protein [Sedimentisphaerales bacterium]
MNNCLRYVTVAILLVGYWCADTAAIGPPTVPPSSIRSGLVTSPNPIDTSYNLIVTGNVAGGKHFRGIVPYNAITDFGGRLGSTSLDSFLRRSAGSDYLYTGDVRPYYSQTRSVTTAWPDQLTGFASPTTAISSSVSQRPLVDTLGTQQNQYLPDYDMSLSGIRYRPMSMPLQQLQKVITDEMELSTYKIPPELLGTVKYKLRPDVAAPGQRLQQLPEETPQVKDGFSGLEDSFGVTTQRSTGRDETIESVYDLLRRPVKPAEPDRKAPAEDSEESDSGQETIGARFLKESSEQQLQDEELIGREESVTDRSAQQEGIFPDKGADLSSQARVVLGQFKNAREFWEFKFNEHIEAAEKYLKQGRYYRAADAYTLASIYKQNDLVVSAGKSHALFAAGEYISSALFLSRVLEAFGEYADTKVDLVALIGDRDVVDNRILEIQQWLEKSDAGELHFLLGYVYYRMGRLDAAQKALQAAYEKMPDSRAVGVLREAVKRAQQK